MTRAALSEHLAEQIVSGRLPPGVKLPSERQLVERFGLSRPIVREALRSLAERDLVEIQPGRGAYVRGARATDAAQKMDALLRRRQPTPRDLVEARTMLECAAAALAAERAEPDDLQAMDVALVQLDHAAGVLEQTRHDLAFHLAIARAARNPVIETMFGAITGLTVEVMLRSLGDPVVARAAVPYHRAIYAAIQDRDGPRARQTMGSHLAVAANLYGDDYDRSLDRVAQRELERLLAPGATLDALLRVTVPDAMELGAAPFLGRGGKRKASGSDGVGEIG